MLNAEYGSDTITLESGQTLEVFPILTDPNDRIFSLTSREDFVSHYDGVLLAFQKRLSRGWQALVSYTWSESTGLLAANWKSPGSSQTGRVTNFSGSSGRDPNNFTNATGNLLNDRTHMFRIQGAVQLPKIDVLVGANYQYRTGKPYAAQTRVRLPQGSQTIYIETPGSRRLSAQNLLDLRLSKIFRFGETGRVEILADILNLFDQAEEQIITRLNTSSNFAEGSRWLTRRRAMIGMKFVYWRRPDTLY